MTAMSDRLQLRSDRLEWRAVDGEVVALDVSTSEYLAINASGRLMWEALARGATRDGLVTLLVDEYALDPTTAERDADVFIAELRRRGLLTGP